MARGRMKRGICFDTTPLIWGVRGDATPGQEHMIERAKRYIERLTTQGFSIIVPAPVIAEYFVGATATQMHEAEVLTRGFEYPSLDVRSATLAAVLQRGGVVDAIHSEYGTPKPMIRIDSFIIAIAVVANAEKIITNNIEEFRKLAGGRIAIDTVPEQEKRPGSLFPAQEDEGG